MAKVPIWSNKSPEKSGKQQKKIKDALLFQCVRPDFISKVDDNNKN